MCVCVHVCVCMHAPTSGSKPFGLAFNVSDSKAFIQSVISSSVSHYTQYRGRVEVTQVMEVKQKMEVTTYYVKS